MAQHPYEANLALDDVMVAQRMALESPDDVVRLEDFWRKRRELVEWLQQLEPVVGP